MSVFRVIALPAASALTVLACASSHNTAAVPNTATTPGVTNAQRADMQVVEQLATARCRHEQTCNNVGPGKTYVTADICMQQMRGSTADELNAYNCPRGISEPGLKHCLMAIDNQQCGNMIDSLATSNDCRNSVMCLQ
jgi:hypothetical protein